MHLVRVGDEGPRPGDDAADHGDGCKGHAGGQHACDDAALQRQPVAADRDAEDRDEDERVDDRHDVLEQGEAVLESVVPRENGVECADRRPIHRANLDRVR